jgi:hypothetical protein
MSIRLVALGAGWLLSGGAWADSFDFAGRHSTVERAGTAEGPAAYNYSVREADGTVRRRRVAEVPERPRVRTNDLYVDAAYALALEEAAGNTVDSIEDGQFDHGAPMACHCFKTGVKWPYVWTRDTSYSSDLGAGLLDPVRARNSLDFKHSPLDPAIVALGVHDEHAVAQDTGSGGSWPISSDRVVWIHAAAALVPLLPETAARAWEDEVYRTTVDTLAQERRHAYDAASGLYRGETSFLDWREQTYPIWTRDDTLAIASSYALSTNVLHYEALRDAAALATRRGDGRAAQYRREAGELGAAIVARFRNPANGLYGSYLFRDLAPIETYDLLGVALLIESGLLSDTAARQLLAAYPVSEGGPPVIWPEQASQPIYHNRAVWPFVTAYALRAAERVQDGAHAVAYTRSLVRGVAIALSNQENAEFLTLSPHFDDGANSGPVINSESQLWSVAAALDLVDRGLFGITTGVDGIHIAPSFPAMITGRLPQVHSVWTLSGVRLGEGVTTVTMRFPAELTEHDWLQAGTIRVDGAALMPGATLDVRHPPQRIDIELVAHPGVSTPLNLVQVADPHALTAQEHARLYAPPPPLIDAIADDRGRVRVAVGGLLPGHDWSLWRDGVRVAGGHAALAHDTLPRVHGAACYTLRQATANGHTSLPSTERCTGASEGTLELSAGDAVVQTEGPATRSSDPTRLTLWGAPQATVHFPARIRVGGRQRLTVLYRNDGRINTGVTAAVKAVTLRCDGVVQTGTLVMPQLGDPVRRGRSTPLEFDAPAGAQCEVTLSDGLNMSYLQHFRHYTAGRGGSEGPQNTADLLAIRIEPVEQAPRAHR